MATSLPNSRVDVAAGATFSIEMSGLQRVVKGLTGAGTVDLGTNTLTISTDAYEIFTGNTIGFGGLVKDGTGVQSLALRGLAHTGLTLVQRGQLIYTGVAGSTAQKLQIAAGASVVNDAAGLMLSSLTGEAGSIFYTGAHLYLDLAGASTFAGTLSGGELIKRGAGTLSLTGGARS